MSTTDYNSATDGDLIVKASALEAAFARYHQKYQQDRATVMDYKGSVATMSALYALLNDSTVTLSVGDVYNVTATGENFAYRDPGAGTHQPADYWDNLGSIVDLTGYATEDYVDDKFENDLTIDGDLTVTGGIEANGEVTAKETVVQNGVSTVVNHNLTDKLDADDYQAAYTWADAAGKFTWASIKGDTSTTGDTTTPNLNLVKPGLGTSVDVTDLNSNFDKIDAAAKLRVANGAGNAVSVNQLTFLDNANSLWKNLDEVRIYNNTDVLYCKEGINHGILLTSDETRFVSISWNAGVPAIASIPIAVIDAVGRFLPSSDPKSHNNIFRGLNLSTRYTLAEIKTMISSGSFWDMYIGDYYPITISSTYKSNEVVNLIFTGFNDSFHKGDTKLSVNHAHFVTNRLSTTHQMNSTNTTVGGLKGSAMWTTVIPNYVTAFNAVLGNSLLTWRDLITNTVNTDAASSGYSAWKCASSNWEWINARLQLLSEAEVYGTNVFSSSGYDTGIAHSKLKIFELDPNEFNTANSWYWLSNVVHSAGFAGVNGDGRANANGASYSYGVRFQGFLGA